MCSLSESSSDINNLKDRLGGMVLCQRDTPESCDSSCKSLVPKDRDVGELYGIDSISCDVFTEKAPVIRRNRKGLMQETSAYLKDTLEQIGHSKIAEVINIEGGSSVHIGHVVNITEQLVLNVDELELDSQKRRDYSQYFYMIDRMRWLAQPSVDTIDYIKQPAKYVIICHTATEEAFTQAENILMLRMMQTFHIESQRWADIAYNFCIGSDGNVYEGRGWWKEGCHTMTYNKFSVGIAFIGCFLSHLPPNTALKRCQDLIAHGVKIGAISEDYELVGHCQCRPFLSPGQRLFEEIKTWKNFNPNITNTTPCVLQPETL